MRNKYGAHDEETADHLNVMHEAVRNVFHELLGHGYAPNEIAFEICASAHWFATHEYVMKGINLRKKEHDNEVT